MRRDLNQHPDRPDFNIGTDAFHTPGCIVDTAVEFFSHEGFTLGIDRPYHGTMVPVKYYRKDKHVASVMLEVNRKLYLAEGSRLKNERFDEIKGMISRFLRILG